MEIANFERISGASWCSGLTRATLLATTPRDRGSHPREVKKKKKKKFRKNKCPQRLFRLPLWLQSTEPPFFQTNGSVSHLQFTFKLR